MNDKHQQSANQHLDHRSALLGKKHAVVLDHMTSQALNAQGKRFFLEFSKPTVAWAFSILFVMGVVFNFYDQAPTNTVPKMAAIPAWVSDTQVPVPVIEQLKFYTWLAQHIEEDNESLHTISQSQATKTDTSWVFKSGSRQQLASLNAP